MVMIHSKLYLRVKKSFLFKKFQPTFPVFHFSYLPVNYTRCVQKIPWIYYMCLFTGHKLGFFVLTFIIIKIS